MKSCRRLLMLIGELRLLNRLEMLQKDTGACKYTFFDGVEAKRRLRKVALLCRISEAVSGWQNVQHTICMHPKGICFTAPALLRNATPRSLTLTCISTFL